MKANFDIELLEFKTINELPNSWNTQEYRNILSEFGFDDISILTDSEVEEMCLLAILDNEPNESATILLQYVFMDKLNSGQIDNLSHEMQSEKLWEEYADLSLHEQFYTIGQLLYKAFNGVFPLAEAVEFSFKINSENSQSLELLDKDTESQLVKIISQGLPENCLINRLFKSQLKNDSFPEAKDIIWQFTKTKRADNEIVFEVISSPYWFKNFKYVENYSSELLILECNL